MVQRDGIARTASHQTASVRVVRGIVAGVPDLFVLHRGIAHMIEIKTPAGVLSDAQRMVAIAVLAAGRHVGVARNADEALACLDAWGIPPGTATDAVGECRGNRRGPSPRDEVYSTTIPSRQMAMNAWVTKRGHVTIIR